MACCMTNPKTFESIDGTPIKYNGPGAGILDQRNVRAESAFWGKLVNFARLPLRRRRVGAG